MKRLSVYFIVALRNLVQARRRTLFLSLALMMVTTLLVLLSALSQGLTDNMIRASTTLASGHVNVGGYFKLTPGDVVPIVLDRNELRSIVKESVPEAELVIDRQRGWSKLVSETSSVWSSLAGIDPAEEQRLASVLTLAPERDYIEGGGDARPGDLSQIGQPGTIVIFANTAKRIDARVGDQITVVAETMRGAANSAELTVAAVAQDMGMMSVWTAIVNKDAIRQLYSLGEETSGAVMVYLKDVSKTDEVLARLQTVFKEKDYTLLDHKSEPYWQKFEPLLNEDWTGFRLDLTTWEDEAAFLKWILAGLDGVSFFLIGVLILIIVIGIMNTMWMSVRERTGEVGTLRAIGMQRRSVLALFVIEALILGAIASSAGGLLGAVLASSIDAAAISVPSDAARMILLSDTLHLSIGAGQVARAVVVFTLVTGVSALWPALRAARMRPVTAIHHVG